MKTIIISEVISDSKAISRDKGVLLFNKIDTMLSEGKDVILDYQGIELLITVFLNAAIGQLFSKYEKEKIEKSLTHVNISSDDLQTVNLVINNAPSYFENRKIIEKSIKRNFPNA